LAKRQRTVGESWAAIEAWLATNAPSLRKSLRPAAADAAIDKLQSKLGRTLPADFVESLRVHDGQKSSADDGLMPMADDPILGEMPSCRLLSVAEIAREWAMMKELHDMGEFAGQKTRPAKGVGRDWWGPGWVPLADNGGGDYFCLDLAPARVGAAGQVIVFFHDMDERPLVAKSFRRWLNELASDFEAGKYTMDDDEGLVAS
jgi:cell wall assembly regulator SMI1